MSITLKDILPELHKSVPAFVMDPKWLEIEGTYLVFGDFARFICSEAEVLQYVSSEEEASQLSHVKVSMAFLERALKEGDREGARSCFGLPGVAYFLPLDRSD